MTKILEGPLQNFYFLCRPEIQDGHHHRTNLTLDPMEKIL